MAMKEVPTTNRYNADVDETKQREQTVMERVSALEDNFSWLKEDRAVALEKLIYEIQEELSFVRRKLGV